MKQKHKPKLPVSLLHSGNSENKRKFALLHRPQKKMCFCLTNEGTFSIWFMTDRQLDRSGMKEHICVVNLAVIGMTGGR